MLPWQRTEKRGAGQKERRDGEGDKEMLPWGSERRGALQGEGLKGGSGADCMRRGWGVADKIKFEGEKE